MEENRQLCLKWNDHQSTLIQNFDVLLESGMLTDCTLAAEGKYVKAHKLVLSACSPYFEGLLNEHYDKHPVFILKDVKFHQLTAMMDYMYKGEVNVSEDQLTALLSAAESLKIKGLSVKDSGAQQTTTNNESTITSRECPQPGNKNKHSKNQFGKIFDIPKDSVDLVPKDDGPRAGSQSPPRKRKRSRRISLNDESFLSHHATTNKNVANHTNGTICLPVKNELGGELVQPKYEYVDIEDSFSRQSEVQSLLPKVEQNTEDSTTHGFTQSSFSSWDHSETRPNEDTEIITDRTLESQHCPQDYQYYSATLDTPYDQSMPSIDATSKHVRSMKQNKKETGSNVYQCKQCPKSFNYDRSLWRHMKFECSKEPRFKCPYCPFLSKQSTNVSVHVRGRHKGMKICYIDIFRNKSNV